MVLLPASSVPKLPEANPTATAMARRLLLLCPKFLHMHSTVDQRLAPLQNPAMTPKVNMKGISLSQNAETITLAAANTAPATLVSLKPNLAASGHTKAAENAHEPWFRATERTAFEIQ